MTTQRGIYLLFLTNHAMTKIEIGKIGFGSFPKGLYLYVGSALSPGGLEKRLARHLSHQKKVFWHIDYLTTSSTFSIHAYLEIITDEKIECQINQMMAGLSENESKIILKKFGSSDCKCTSHLTYFKLIQIETLQAKILELLTKYQTRYTKVKN
ncbi:MAG: GIY-YIG nuclease family protein [Candidatus Heimdallarchaeota archaeon]